MKTTPQPKNSFASLARLVTAGVITLAFVSNSPAAIKTWNGLGGTTNWSTSGNWGGTAPVNGDDLVFAGPARLFNSNDIVVLKIKSLGYSSSGFLNVPLTNGPGYTLTITNGITDNAGNNTNNIPLILGASQSFSNQVVATAHQLGGTMNMSNFSLTIGGAGNVYINGVISGNGAIGANVLNVNTTGTNRLTAANTFNGGVNINSGMVQLGNAGGIPSGGGRGNLFIASGATVDLGNQSPTVNGLNGLGVVDEVTTNTGAYTLALGTANSNGVFGGVIQNTFGTVSLVKNGTGTQTNSGANTYSGSTTVNGGALVLNGANTYIGSTFINGGSLVLDVGGSIGSTNITILPGGVFNTIGAGGFTLNGSLLAGRASGFASDILGNFTLSGGNVTIRSAGLAGTMTFGNNLNLSGGTLNFDLSSTSTPGGGTNDLISLNGGNLDLSGGTTTIKIKPIAGSLNGTYTLINGSLLPIVGSAGANLLLGSTPRGIVAALDTTTQPTNVLLTASGTPNPASIVWAGNGAGGAWDVTTSVNWLSNGVPDIYYDLDTVTLNDAAGAANSTVSVPAAVSPAAVTVDNSAFNYTLGLANADAGLISGSASLTKNGTGSLVINLPNNYSGTTTVNGGAIVLGNYSTGSFVNNIVLYNGVTPGTVTLGNGGLFMTGTGNTLESIEIGNLVINPGGSSLAQRNRQSNALPFWTIDGFTRNVGGTLDMNNLQQRAGSHVGIYFTNLTANTINGILGGHTTWNLNDWLVPQNTLVGALPYAAYQVNATASAWGVVSNVNVTASPSAIAASQVINSIRLPVAATVTINAGQSLTLASGGVLLPNNGTGSAVITGGTLLGATNADLIATVNNAGNSLTVASVIADNTNGLATGGSALTKAGQGTLILTGNNTYSGATYVNGGTASGNNNGNNLPTSIAAGILQIGSGGTSGGISNSVSVANSGTLAFNRSDTVGYAGLISGTGGVKQQGAGTLILTANNTYSGAITITAGTLQIGNGGASGSFSNSASVANGGALVVNRTGALTYAGQITGIGTLAVQGGAKLTLNTNNTYSGNTTVTSSTLALGASGSISNSALISLAAGTFDASAAGGIVLNGAGGGQVLAGTGGVKGNVTSVANTRVSPGGDAVIGTLTLTNDMTAAGGIINIDVNGGSRDLLDIKGSLTLTSGTVVLNNLGAAIPNGSYKIISYAGALAGVAGNLSISGFSQSGQVASLSSATAGEIDLVISSYVAVNLIWQGDGVNNFWDVLTTSDWTNSAGVATLFHQFDNAVFNDTTLNTTVNLQTALTPNQITVNGTVNSYTLQGVGSIAGGSLTNNNPNTLIILTTNTYSGNTTINAGTVQFGNGTTAGTIGSGPVLDNGALVFYEPDSRSLSGAMTGAGSLTLQAGELTLSGNNSGFSGPTTITAGTLQVGVGGASGTLGTGPVTNNSALVFNRSGTLSSSASVTGSGVVSNIGPGTVTLSGINTYGGLTVIDAGTVKVGSSAAIPSGLNASNVVMNGGATAAGVLDLNGFNTSINGLDGAAGTVLSQVVNNSGTATNALMLGNNEANGNFSGTIKDNSGSGGKITLVKTGTNTQTLNIPSLTVNTYSGGTIISNGMLRVTTPGGGSPVNINASQAAIGAGPVTFYGGELSLAGTIPQSTGPFWGNWTGTLIVPTNQVGTMHGAQRGIMSPTFLGGGTLVYITAYVRGELSCDATAFYGNLVFAGDSNGNNLGLDTTTGFPNAHVVLKTNVFFYVRVAGTPTIPIGELAGDVGTALASTSSGSAGGLAANFMIGGLNTSTNFDGNVVDNIGLIKVGSGALTLNSATISYTGITTVSNGVLSFAAALPSSSSYTLSAPGILDASVPGPLTVGSGVTVQTILGNGTLNGSLTVGGLGVVQVGFSNRIGTLTVTNVADLSAANTIYMELNRTNSPGGTNDQIAAKNIILGGTLNVTNLGPALHVGDTFKLFKASGTLSGTLGTVNLPATDATATTYTWTDNTAANGSITVLTAVSSVNTTPTNIVAVVNGGNLELSWPPDHIGWRLEVQTNLLSTGLATNWVNVPGANTVSSVTNTYNPANGTVFYRMVYQIGRAHV